MGTGSSSRHWVPMVLKVLLTAFPFVVFFSGTPAFASTQRRERGLIQAPANKEQPFGKCCIRAREELCYWIQQSFLVAYGVPHAFQ